MSLLLQALQKAARSREGAETTAESAASAEDTSLTRLTAEDLSLEEDDFAPPVRGLGRDRSRAPAVTAQAEAATVLAASTAAPGFTDFVRERPIPVFMAAAFLLALLYGTYVWVQISHPAWMRGEFSSPAPLRVMSRPPAPRPVSIAPKAAPPPAPLASLAAGAPASATVAPAVLATSPPTTRLGPPPPPPVAHTDSTTEPPINGTPARPPPRLRGTLPSPRAAARPGVPAGKQGRNAEARADVNARGGNLAAPSSELQHAWELLQAGGTEEAQSIYQRAAAADPGNVDALLGLAATAAQKGDAEEAIRHYERALEREPRNAAAQAGLIALIGQADPQASETRLRQLITQDTSAAFLHASLGGLLARQGKWSPAEQAFFQAFQLQPDNADYAYNLAVSLEHLSQPGLALNYYRKALDLAGLKGRATFDRERARSRVSALTAGAG